ncbi:hypothetical protein BofuT4_P008960.1 [Botrytis cinerea T4]|uniref:Uncharacterized protein n=1 Tax=Botryotinia fuckeliana (strain T4) TaxID=999810 RepID=G2XXA1_BOTF4|nr:hypothetical protein BofuT4_P008960.1 [Botrytis cinerea T4]
MNPITGMRSALDDTPLACHHDDLHIHLHISSAVFRSWHFARRKLFVIRVDFDCSFCGL